MLAIPLLIPVRMLRMLLPDNHHPRALLRLLRLVQVLQRLLLQCCTRRANVLTGL